MAVAEEGAIISESYAPREGARISQADAEALGRVMERLDEQGMATPEALLEEARRARSPIHHLFEWDDETAAAEYRLAQARRYYRIIVKRVEFSDGHAESFDAFTLVHLDPADLASEEQSGTARNSRYVRLNRIVQRPDLQEQVIQGAREALASYKRRYDRYRKMFPRYAAVFGRIHDDIDVALRESE